jgi:transposase InsO family protein
MDHKKKYTIGMMCRVLEVSQSAYYNWQSGRSQKREVHKKNLRNEIKRIFKLHRGHYGSPRIATELGYSETTIRKHMNALGLKSKRRKKYVATTDSKHDYLVCENILNRRFDDDHPHGAWVSDITFIQTTEGWLYMTAVIDLEDRKVIGWSFSKGLTAEETTLKAFRMAVKNKPPQKGLIFHSDRGVQYCCYAFANLLESYGITRSMSRKGDCWDNAVAESFFKTLKVELVYETQTVSRERMMSLLFEYIETYYNKIRRHSALGNLTIDEFTKLKLKKVA